MRKFGKEIALIIAIKRERGVLPPLLLWQKLCGRGYKRNYGGLNCYGEQWYQFTMIDECSRWCFQATCTEHSTCGAEDFLKKLIIAAPFPIRAIQTDNKTEWTNALLIPRTSTLSSRALQRV
ncbi:MAG: hypothetical protein LBN02_08990 [Oscillospiraceae bacterium]|nr:hypothetical protein [Oscillospiraceae bacterium]